jgi:hypothetical protein
MNKFSFSGPLLLSPPPATRGNHDEDGDDDEKEDSDTTGNSITMMTTNRSLEKERRGVISTNNMVSNNATVSTLPETGATAAATSSTGSTDFDFGDLVTMTIIDVFETDQSGKLLSYCPTFDTRAVHKTLEVREMLEKGAVQFKEKIGELVVMQRRRHGVGTGKNVNKVRLGFAPKIR